MSGFRNGALRALGRLYNFVGPAQAPDSLDISSGVQLVHDVSREAEQPYQGMIPGDRNGQGFVHLEGSDLAFAGAGTQYADVSFTNATLIALGLEAPFDWDFYLWAITFGGDATNLQSFQAQLHVPVTSLLSAYPGGGASSLVKAVPLLSVARSAIGVDSSGTFFGIQLTTGDAGWYLPRPILVPAESIIYARVQASGAGNFGFGALCRVLRRGAAPRGAA